MKAVYIILLAAIPFILNGCRSAVGSVEREYPEGTSQMVADKRIQPDFTLRQKIASVQVNEAVVSDNLTQVQVVLVNLKRKPITIQFDWEWFNEVGMKVGSSSGWKELHFEGKEEKAITSIAPTPKAADFKLKMKEI